MKKYFPFLLLFVFVVACGVSAPPQTQAPVIENTSLPTEAVQFTPIPTMTTTPLPTEAFPNFVAITVPPASGQVAVIRFASNGTYADVTDTIALGSSKTYSVNAMKGQIMSVSVLPEIPAGDWGTILMQIKGADGSILCPQSSDRECLYWRGALPASQDYFITLTPNGNIPKFALRVAINPPGKDVQYFQYNNPATGLSLTYTDSFVPAIPVPGNYKVIPELTLRLIDAASYEKTNLGEVYLFVSSTSDAQIVPTCAEPNQGGGGTEQVIGNEVINGYAFVHSNSMGAGAGNYYEQEIYRALVDNTCYEVIYYLHSSNIGSYTPGTVTEFDRNAVVQKLYGVFATFIIK